MVTITLNLIVFRNKSEFFFSFAVFVLICLTVTAPYLDWSHTVSREVPVTLFGFSLSDAIMILLLSFL